MSIEIRNDNRQRILNQTNDLILKALTQCGETARGEAITNITRLKAVDTGALRNSITYKVVDEDNSHVCYVGTNMEYAPYIEFGTGKHVAGGRKSKWKYKDKDGNWHQTEGMRPRPYLKPAVAENTGKYEQIIKDIVKM